jgi:hypothetical protein
MTTPSNWTGGGELLGDVDGVLAGHGVDDEQDRVRLDRVADVDELVHQRLVDVQAPGRVDDEHVLALGLGAIQRPARDVDRVALGALLVDVGADLPARPSRAGRPRRGDRRRTPPARPTSRARS